MQKRMSASRGDRGSLGPSTSSTKQIQYKREEVKLQKAENAWKPGDKDATNLPATEKEHLALIKSFRGMLNKITPSTFKTLLAKVIVMFCYLCD